MSIFASYIGLFVSSTYIGVALLSWFQMNYLHLRPEAYLPGLPLTMIITTVLIIIDAVIIYLITKPFERVVRRIKNGGMQATDVEKAAALKTYKRMNTVTIIITIVGFIFGQGITTTIKVMKGTLPAEFPRIAFAMVQGTIYGAMAAMYTVLVMNEKFAEYRKLLKIHKLEEKEQTTTIRGTIVLLVVVCICYLACNMMMVPYQLIFLQKTKPVADAFSFYLVNSLKAFGITILTGFWPIHVILSGISKRMKATSVLVKDLASKGDLSYRIDISMIDDFGVLTSSINGLMDKISELLVGMQSGTTTVTRSAEKLSEVAGSASAALIQMTESFNRVNDEDLRQNQLIVEVNNDINGLRESAASVENFVIEQSSSMQQNSASISQMVSNIKSVAELTRKADALSNGLSGTSEKGNAMISQAVTAISQIQEASEKVQEIVKVIQKIASQTNLLSMNAAIEAAHAGEYGAGFAVVADEVRSLASSSSKSAKDIQTHIQDMVSKIEAGVQAITESGEAFKQIEKNVNENSQLIETISNAMEEQGTGAEETMKVTLSVTEALEHINELVKQQSVYSENVKKAMHTVVESAEKVTEAIGEGKVASTELERTVDQVGKTVTENLDTVEKMKQQMTEFSV